MSGQIPFTLYFAIPRAVNAGSYEFERKTQAPVLSQTGTCSTGVVSKAKHYTEGGRRAHTANRVFRTKGLFRSRLPAVVVVADALVPQETTKRGANMFTGNDV